jgi:hypothetical protein
MESIDITIKKDKRNNGRVLQKGPRVGSTITKSIATKDISESVKDDFFTRNYINLESKVLNYCKVQQFTFFIDDLR